MRLLALILIRASTAIAAYSSGLVAWELIWINFILLLIIWDLGLSREICEKVQDNLTKLNFSLVMMIEDSLKSLSFNPLHNKTIQP